MPRWLLIGLLRLTFRILFRVRVVGRPRVRAERLLIVANHESFLDELLLCLFLPYDPVFVVYKSATRSRWFRLLSRCLIDCMTIEPNNPMEMKSVIRLVESGRPVLIFPEGRLTTTGNLMKTYDGPGFVAAHTRATVLPVRISGTARSRFSRVQGNFARTLFPRVRLFVQNPTQIEAFLAPHGEQHYLAGQAMHRIMTDMMFAGRAEQTLIEALIEAARIHGRHWHVISDIEYTGYTYTYLIKTALIAGRKIADISREGEYIGILLPNVATLLSLIFGLSAWRRIPTLLSHTARAESLQAACVASGVRYVITSRHFIEQFRLGNKLETLAGVQFIYMEDLHARIGIGDWLWWQVARCNPRAFIPESTPQEPALVMFTAGSETRCKGVVLSHAAILANVSQMRSVLDFSVNDVIFNALPMHHAFGLTCGGLIPLLCGAQVFLYPSPEHYRVIPEIAYSESCTILFGTNTFLANYARLAHPFDFHRLRYIVAGAEKITEDVRELWFEKFGVRILEGYGATETAPVLSVNTMMASRSGSVGQFLPSIQYYIEPLAGMEPANGNVCGRLHVKGPNLMLGYLRSSQPGVLQPPVSAHGDGWYDTGDIVEIDPEGFVYVIGRVKRFARIDGELVSLGVVELIASQVAPGFAHAATSVAIDTATENIVLFTTRTDLTCEALASSARTQGAPLLAIPHRIIHVDAIPRLGSGKTDSVTLKQWALAA